MWRKQFSLFLVGRIYSKWISENSFSAIKRLKEFLYLFLPLFCQWGRIEHLKHSILNFIWTSEHILNTSWSGCSFSTFISESNTQTCLSSIFDPTGLFSRTYYLFFSRIIIISSFVCFFLPIFSAFGRVWLSIISNLSFRGCLWGILSLKTLIWSQGHFYAWVKVWASITQKRNVLFQETHNSAKTFKTCFVLAYFYSKL